METLILKLSEVSLWSTVRWKTASERQGRWESVKPSFEIYITDKLHEAGCRAYIVGGCVETSSWVRIHDWDVNGRWQGCKTNISDFNIMNADKTWTWRLMMESVDAFEITTYRTSWKLCQQQKATERDLCDNLERTLRHQGFHYKCHGLESSGRPHGLFWKEERPWIRYHKDKNIGNPVSFADALRMRHWDLLWKDFGIRAGSACSMHHEISDLSEIFLQKG